MCSWSRHTPARTKIRRFQFQLIDRQGEGLSFGVFDFDQLNFWQNTVKDHSLPCDLELGVSMMRKLGTINRSRFEGKERSRPSWHT